jgi:hypothetical protein
MLYNINMEAYCLLLRFVHERREARPGNISCIVHECIEGRSTSFGVADRSSRPKWNPADKRQGLEKSYSGHFKQSYF